VIHRPRADDPRLTAYRHIGDHRWLRERGLFVAEGRLVVERLISHPAYEIASVNVSPAAFDALQPLLETVSCDVFICDVARLQELTGFNFHRGCLAIARRSEPVPLESLFGATRLVALEGIGNPDNVGGIFRTAAALGAQGVVIDPTTGDPLYRKAIRTSMGAVLQLPWIRLGAWIDDLRRFRAAGFRLVALTPDATAQSLQEFASAIETTDRLMLMLGAEGSGLTQSALEAAEVRLRIPIDAAFDSLNVVVAAGIALERLHNS
jgi:tRNA G18 (ribose-2'-O)-methylase SpoU